MIAKVQGALYLLLAIAMMIPVGVGWVFNEMEQVKGFSFAIGITGSIGILLSLIKPKVQTLRLKESILLVLLTWFGFVFFGALPYLFCNIFSFTDAIFETTSGFTTTGSSVLVYIESTSKSILFWRSLTQWLGGMGIVVLSLAIMPYLGSHGYNLYRAEASGLSADKIMPRLQNTAKILWTVYVFMTVLFIVLLHFSGMEWFDSICHTFSGISTGGFSTKGNGISHFNSKSIDWIVTAMSFVGGINFLLHYRLFRFSDFKTMFTNREFMAYCLIIIFGSLAVFSDLFWKLDYSLEKSIRLGVFHIINHLTSAGFTHDNYLTWPQFSQALLILTMFIGGCAGSTAGGPKIIRVVVLIKAAALELRKVIHSSGIFRMKIGSNPVKGDVIAQVLGFFVLFFLLQAICTLIMTALGMDLISAFTAVGATLGGTGPAFGSVGPYENYFMVPDPGKWVLIFCMIAGRLEVYSLLVICTLGFWKK